MIFLSDTEAARLAGHPGRVDAIGILAGRSFDPARLRTAAGNALVLTGAARGKAESPELQAGRTRLIAVAASFAGVGAFIALFVIASMMALAVQQREQEIGLLRAIAATPSQVRRMIAWEATIVALLGAAAGLWPGIKLRMRSRGDSSSTESRPPGLRSAMHVSRRQECWRGASWSRCSRCCRRAGVRRVPRRPVLSPRPLWRRDCWDVGA